MARKTANCVCKFFVNVVKGYGARLVGCDGLFDDVGKRFACIDLKIYY